jgi:uncharacterized protein (TIGR03067 family)
MKHFHWPVAAALLALFFATSLGAGDDTGAVKKELKDLEGNWQLTLQEERGAITPKIVVARLRIVIEDGQMSWYIGNPAPNQTADLKVDPTPVPKTIDATITRGSAKDKIMLGIYKLTKNTLEICWAEPGSDKRPKKFTSRPGVGSGNVYTKYEREKEK